jgi:hypothetical protein
LPVAEAFNCLQVLIRELGKAGLKEPELPYAWILMNLPGFVAKLYSMVKNFCRWDAAIRFEESLGLSGDVAFRGMLLKPGGLCSCWQLRLCHGKMLILSKVVLGFDVGLAGNDFSPRLVLFPQWIHVVILNPSEGLLNTLDAQYMRRRIAT